MFNGVCGEQVALGMASDASKALKRMEQDNEAKVGGLVLPLHPIACPLLCTLILKVLLGIGKSQCPPLLRMSTLDAHVKVALMPG